MTQLITGAAGFIGIHFSYYWREHHPNDRLLLLDALTYAANKAALAPLLKQPNVRFVAANIADPKAIATLFAEEPIHAVVNFAAESFVDKSITEPGVFLQSNVVGVQVLLDACRAHGNIRFHQISTDEVYGDLPLDRPDQFFTESTNLHTSSPYSASKAAADLLVQAYHRTYQLPVTISRCSNNYGPWQFPEKLIPKMIQLAQQNKALPVFGRGANVRDWLHVTDHCRAIEQILLHGRLGEVYNVGGHNERDNLTVVRSILQQLGKPESLIHYIEDRAGHDLRYAIDPAKIQRELGWQPSIGFNEGLRSTIQWYQEHPDFAPQQNKSKP